jgi:hypothetical protein
MLRSVCGLEHTVGFDQFVYFDASNPLANTCKNSCRHPAGRVDVHQRLAELEASVAATKKGKSQFVG